MVSVAGLGKQGDSRVSKEGVVAGVGRQRATGHTWLALLGLRQQELSRRLEVVAWHEHQLLKLEQLLYVLQESGQGVRPLSLGPCTAPLNPGVPHKSA